MGIATSKYPLLSNKHCINNYDEMFESNNDDYKMHLMHCIFKEIWEANFRAPVDMALQLGAKVLDVGVLKPGGWIEIVDSELGFVSEGPYTRGVVEASNEIDILVHVSHQQKNYEIGSNSGKISEQLSMNLRETFREFLLKFDGEMEIDSGLTNTRRPTSLGSAYENAHKLKDYGVHPEPYTKSGNAKHKRKSGWDGSRIYGRRDDISNKENTSHVATQETCKIIKNERSKTDSGIRSPKIILSKKSAIRKEKKVEMIIERISQEFDLYQSMILMHRFWARKANDTTTSNE
ncbi:13093_t:CDS:2 [Acaulospora colombiana]|uniref:13093_t:CDS:1 n=1 Tax=Acaulospora colombiana TaxID=27376 RepID=A0ACA9KZ26_9GLOM|nr:13093_t:CDS:2 [Acaulospora colombiana]